MKITIESANIPETEVIIRGDVTGSEIASVLRLLRSKSSSKLILCREDEQFIIDAQDVVYIETGSGKTLVYTGSETYESREKLYELQDQLAALGFTQINKSTLVNINCVKSIHAEFSGNYCIRLKARPEILIVSRKYFKEFKESI